MADAFDRWDRKISKPELRVVGGSEFYADDIDALIEEFNERYFVVNEAGRAIIYEPTYDVMLARSRFERITFEDLKRLYLNRMIETGEDDKGNAKRANAASVWLHHPARRQYIKGIRFDPTGATEDGVLNLWRGFAIEPAAGCWTRMHAHIRDIICAGDPARLAYIMGWMARLVQFPAQQGEVAVVLRGGEGTGKGTLAKALLRILGQHGLAISNAKHLVGNFNAHLRDAVLLFADEAFFAGDKQHVGTLKSLITEPYLTIEAKHQNAVQTPNYLHVMMASNEDWVVPASQDARRWAVYDVSAAAQRSYDYFDAIAKEMEAGGYAAMLHDLLAYDLSRFNIRDIPITEGLHQQRKLSLPVAEQWWMDCLLRGHVFKSKLGLANVFGVWLPEVTTGLLFESYDEFARRHGDRHPMSRETLGRFMQRFGQAKRLQNKPIGEQMTEEASGMLGTQRVARPIIHPRPYGYTLGTLDDARAAFTDATNIPVEWGGDDADDFFPT